MAALAAAQPDLLCFGHGELLRRDIGDLVRAVAERLALRAAAGAPPVVARGELDRVGSLLRDQRLCQVPSFARFSKRVNWPRNASSTMPIGPFLCLPMMISALPFDSGLSGE